MKLLAFGESFTVGQNSEYCNEKYGGLEPPDQEEYHQFSYITHIFNENKDIFNNSHIIAGCGWDNTKIWFEIRNYFQNYTDKDVFVVIGWTSPTRNRFYYEPENSNYTVFTPKQRILMNEFLELGLLNYTSLVFNYETLILATHSYLNLLGIKHLMVQAFHDHKHYFGDKVFPIISFNSKIDFWPNWDKRNNTLFDIVRKEYCNSEAQSMGEGNHDKEGFKRYTYLDTISSCCHPSPKGYKLIGETLSPYIRKILKNDIRNN